MTLSIILYVAFSLLIIGLAVRGFFKGPINGAVGVLRTLISAAAAFGLVRLIAFLLPASKILAAASALIDSDAGFLITAVASLSGALICSALLPFVFGLLFCLFYILLIVPSRTLAKAIDTSIAKKKSVKSNPEPSESTETAENADTINGKAKKRFPFAKVGGSLIRIVDAVLIAVIVLLPFSGIIYTFTDGIDAILTSAEDSKLEIEADFVLFGEDLTNKSGKIDFSKAHDVLNEKTSPVCDNLFLKLSYIAPFKSLYSVMGASEGSNIAEGNEISQTLELCSDLVYLAKPLNEYGNDQIKAIDGIGTYISGSYFHSEVAANLVSQVSSELLEDDEALKDNGLSMILVPLLEGLAESTPETIGANVETLSVVASELIESGVLADTENAANALANEDLLAIVITEVLGNDHLRTTASEMVNSALAEVITQLDEDADVEKLKVDFDSVDKDEIKEEAAILARLISRAYSASVALDGGTLSDVDVAEAVKLLGISLDDARKSELLSETTDELIMAVIDSGKLGNSADGLSEIVEKHLDDDGLSYANLLSSVAELFKILDTCKDDNKTNNVADITAALESLTSTLDPVTSAIIKEFIEASPELFGVGSEDDGDGEISASTQNSQKIVNVFVDKLSSGEISEDEYEREAKALDYAIMLVTMKENEGISSVKDVYGTPEGMNEMITMFIDSEITSDAIKEIAYDEDGNLTYDALDIAADFDKDDEESFLIQSEMIYHAKSVSGDSDMDTVRENLITVAAVFGIDIKSHIDSWEKME